MGGVLAVVLYTYNTIRYIYIAKMGNMGGRVYNIYTYINNTCLKLAITTIRQIQIQIYIDIDKDKVTDTDSVDIYFSDLLIT